MPILDAYMAAISGDDKLLFAHFKNKCIDDINETYKNKTLIFAAAEVGSLSMVKFLVKNGADISIPNGNGVLPMHIAAAKGHVDLIDYFGSLRLNLQEKNKVNGSTCAHYAANNGQNNVLMKLEFYQAQHNDEDKMGATPFQLAVHGGHLNTVIYLSRYFLDTGALDIAIRKRHVKIVSYLQQHAQIQADWDRVYGSTFEKFCFLLRNYCADDAESASAYGYGRFALMQPHKIKHFAYQSLAFALLKDFDKLKAKQQTFEHMSNLISKRMVGRMDQRDNFFIILSIVTREDRCPRLPALNGAAVKF